MNSICRGITVAVSALATVGASMLVALCTAHAAGWTSQQQALSFVVTTFEDNQPQVRSEAAMARYAHFAQTIELQAAHAVPSWKFYMLADELAAWFHDQHAYIIAPHSSDALPIGFYWASNGIVAIPLQNSPKVVKPGDQVLKVGGRTIASLETVLPHVLPGNRYVQRFSAGNDLWSGDFLRMLGVVSPGGYVTLELRHARGETYSVRVKLVPWRQVANSAAQSVASTFQRRFLLPPRVWPADNQDYLWKINTTHDYGVLWLAQCVPSKGIDRAIGSFFEQVEARHIGNVVIDVQNNSGGMDTMVNSFLRYLTTPSKGDYTYGPKGLAFYTLSHPKNADVFRGRVYVVVNWGTMSAAVSLADVLQTNGLATTVGQPTGGPPKSTLNPHDVTVPNTRLVVTTADMSADVSGLLQADSPALTPQIPLRITVQDIQSGANPLAEWIDGLGGGTSSAK